MPKFLKLFFKKNRGVTLSMVELWLSAILYTPYLYTGMLWHVL